MCSMLQRIVCSAQNNGKETVILENYKAGV
jgi:hypothetical protein